MKGTFQRHKRQLVRVCAERALFLLTDLAPHPSAAKAIAELRAILAEVTQ